MENLINAYEDFTDPINLRNYLKLDEDFIKWLRVCTVKELEINIKIFENKQMYEECKLIKKVIDEKNNYSLFDYLFKFLRVSKSPKVRNKRRG